MPLMGLVILMLDMELAMVGRRICRGSNSAAAPLAGTQRFSGALRSRRRQLTQIPMHRPSPALAWGRRRASGRAARSARARQASHSSRAPASCPATQHAPATHCTRPATRTTPTQPVIYLARTASILRDHLILEHDRRETVAQERKMVMN